METYASDKTENKYTMKK